jgi:hypothetical protein
MLLVISIGKSRRKSKKIFHGIGKDKSRPQTIAWLNAHFKRLFYTISYVTFNYKTICKQPSKDKGGMAEEGYG